MVPVDKHNDTILDANQEDISYLDRKARKSFDKSIVALRLAMNRLADIISSTEDNWILHDILLEHRNVLHARIDLLIKQKRKLYSALTLKDAGFYVCLFNDPLEALSKFKPNSFDILLIDI